VTRLAAEGEEVHLALVREVCDLGVEDDASDCNIKNDPVYLGSVKLQSLLSFWLSKKNKNDPNKSCFWVL